MAKFKAELVSSHEEVTNGQELILLFEWNGNRWEVEEWDSTKQAEDQAKLSDCACHVLKISLPAI